MACSRPAALRQLAAELGPALQVARRKFSDYDSVRYLSPVADVLSDIGDTLRAYATMDHEDLQFTNAPPRVAEQISLFVALASRAAPTSSLCSTSSPSPSALPKVCFSDVLNIHSDDDGDGALPSIPPFPTLEVGYQGKVHKQKHCALEIATTHEHDTELGGDFPSQCSLSRSRRRRLRNSACKRELWQAVQVGALPPLALGLDKYGEIPVPPILLRDGSDEGHAYVQVLDCRSYCDRLSCSSSELSDDVDATAILGCDSFSGRPFCWPGSTVDADSDEGSNALPADVRRGSPLEEPWMYSELEMQIFRDAGMIGGGM